MPEVKTDDGCIIHVEVEGPQTGTVLMLSNSLGTNLAMCESSRTRTPERFTPRSGAKKKGRSNGGL